MRVRASVGRVETNLCRVPLWQDGREPMALVARSLLGEFSTSQTLRTLDLKVLAFLLERWATTARELSDPAQFTLYELSQAIYGRRKPSSGYLTNLRASLRRLFMVAISMEGWDGHHNRRDPGLVTLDRLVVSIVSELDHLCTDERDRANRFQAIGRLRGSTFSVCIASWLGRQLQAGHATYLELGILRRLSGVDARVWVYLEAEHWTAAAGAGRRTAQKWIALNEDVYRVLGMNYARERVSRARLAEALRRILT